MSTEVTFAKDQQQRALEEKGQSEEGQWSSIARVLGYPESWAGLLRERVQNSGKTWRWTSENSDGQAGTLMLAEPQQEVVVEERAPQGGRLLLIINSQTPERAVRNALSFAEDAGARISIVYTAVPRLVSEHVSPSEVDWEFTRELSRGRARLESIATAARKLGIEYETHFEWESRPTSYVSKKYASDLVINETA